MDEWRRGAVPSDRWDVSTGRARTAFARLAGVAADDVAIGGTVAGLLSLTAAGLPDGARVVVPEIEFTSNLFPWLVHTDRGVEVVTVPLGGLADAIDERTDLVAFTRPRPMWTRRCAPCTARPQRLCQLLGVTHRSATVTLKGWIVME
jgi:selenocysteine lyase/cysteine desulfurase